MKSLWLARTLPVPLPSTGSDVESLNIRVAACCFVFVLFSEKNKHISFCSPSVPCRCGPVRLLSQWTCAGPILAAWSADWLRQTTRLSFSLPPFYFQGNTLRIATFFPFFSLPIFDYFYFFLPGDKHSPCLTLSVFTPILIYYKLINFPGTAAACVMSGSFFLFLLVWMD